MKKFDCPLCPKDARNFLSAGRLVEHILIAHNRGDYDSVFDTAPRAADGTMILDSGFTHARRERYHALDKPYGSETWRYAQWISDTEIDRAGKLPGEEGYKYPVPFNGINERHDM